MHQVFAYRSAFEPGPDSEWASFDEDSLSVGFEYNSMRISMKQKVRSEEKDVAFSTKQKVRSEEKDVAVLPVCVTEWCVLQCGVCYPVVCVTERCV